MTDEFQEQVLEADDLDEEEEDFVDFIGVLELLVGPGNFNDIPIYPGKEVRIGRDAERCTYFLGDDTVSKQHFRIYSIIYEKDKLHEFPPLIYCEDLESTNGTWVNDVCIGIICRERVGHLLSDGDIIEIKPNIRFQFHQSIHQVELRTSEHFRDFELFNDRFEITDRVLGQGAYGAVYLAKEFSTSRQMACKIIELDVAADRLTERSISKAKGEDWHERLRRVARGRDLVLREIKILSKLNHPHIINLKKAFISSNVLYMLTELAPGGDLFSYLDHHGGHLSDWHSRVIARQIVLAIQYMHSKSVAHRDIKPENVLVMQTDFGGRVVLTDFGFANYLNQHGRLLSRVGTEGFIAPEVDCTEKGYTMAADLWSLGVLTATLLTGSSVVPCEELTRLSQLQIVDRLFASMSHWQDIQPRALNFLRGLLSLDPDKRLTANSALNHSWFKKPLSEAALLEERYEKVIRFWRKRSEDEVIERLPTRVGDGQEKESIVPAPKGRRKVPDMNLSPYLGLDRYLQPKIASKRKMILDTLNKSGSPFLVTEQNRHKGLVVNTSSQMRGTGRIETVEGKDLFASFRSSQAASHEEADLDEICLVPTTPRVKHSARDLEFRISDPQKTLSPIAEAREIATEDGDFEAEKCKKKPRRESEDEEEKYFRDGVTNGLPRYSTAKALKDAVEKKKQEMKSNKMAGLMIRSSVSAL